MLIDSTKRVFELLMACPNAVISTLSNRLLGLLCSNSKKCIIRNFAPVCRCRLMRRSSVAKKLYKVNQSGSLMMDCISKLSPFSCSIAVFFRPITNLSIKRILRPKNHQNRVGQETDAKFFQKLPFSLQNDQLNRFPASTLSS